MSITDSITAPQLDVQESAFTDYFGFQEDHQYFLPDGKQYFKLKVMNEGDKAKFQKRTQRDVVIERQSQNARMKMDQAGERHELIRTCVTDWSLYRQGQPIPFSERALKDFLELASPKIVEDLEKEIRKINPWLLAEMTSEDIQREIDSLEEMKAIAVERERGE
jgi:hypothetical protein